MLHKNLIKLFEKAGWYKTRKIEIDQELIAEYGNYPLQYIDFISRFNELEIKNLINSEFRGKVYVDEFFIKFSLKEFKGLNSTIQNEEGDLGYYSNILGYQLFPVGITNDNWYIAVDNDMKMYLLNMRFNCYLVHENPYEGVRHILENDLYSTTYVLGEEGENRSKWFKREK